MMVVIASAEVTSRPRKVRMPAGTVLALMETAPHHAQLALKTDTGGCVLPG